MRKALFTLSLCLVLCGAGFAQSFALSVTGGYCLPLASSFQSQSQVEVQTANLPNYYTTQQNVVYKSFGQGGNIALSFDWFSKKNIGCGMKLNAMISSPYTSTASVSYLSAPYSGNFTFTNKPFSFQFIPHINFKHDFKVVSPILEMGMLIGITNDIESYEAKYGTGDVAQSTINHHGNVMLGFYSSLGLSFRISGAVRFILAGTCTAASYSPSKWDRTSYVFDGQDRLSNLSVGDKQGVYVKQLDLTAPQPANQPHQSLKYSMPFSNFGINVGFSFVVSKRPKTEAEKRLKEERTRKLWQDTY
jgi:hypothetical protein